jgi:tripartite-type tricarboxylate transporter receptor subunit TctC
MKMWLERILFCAFATCACMAAHAENWPTKNVVIVASAAPGGGVDYIARILAQSLSQQLHQNFIVEDRGGAGGTIGSNQVAQAVPDGYTLLVCSNGEITLAPFVQGHLPYDPLKDLAPVVLIASAPQVIVVNPKVPAKNMKELIAYAQTKGGIGYGTPGFGSSAHVGFELVSTEHKLPFFHVAYKGGGPAVTDLLGGQISMAVVTLPAIAGNIKTGAVRPLAVLAPNRSPSLPDIPTLKEATDIDTRDASSWFAIMAPVKTPPEILAKLEQATLASLTPALRERFQLSLLDVVALPSREFRARMQEESAANKNAIARIGLKLN